jgi:hypothetical protein
LTILLTILSAGAAQQVRRNGFESSTTTWVKGRADVTYEENAHTMTDQGPHDGQRCEYIQITSPQDGKFAYYQYPVGKAPVCEELNAGVWIKANRPGIQLLARIVLPQERDPNDLDNRLTTLIRGDIYKLVGRWQRLEIGRTVILAKQQQQLMQNQLGRPLNFNGAYVDQLVLNVYGGRGMTEVWIDDLEIGPVVDTPEPVVEKKPGLDVKTSLPRPNKNSRTIVELNGVRLLVGGTPFFFRGVRHTDTPLKALRDAGFNTLWVDAQTSPKLLREAADLGFMLAPTLTRTPGDARLVSTDPLSSEVARFPEPDSVLFWDVGGVLQNDQVKPLATLVQRIRTADTSSRPVAGDVWEGFMPYSRTLNLVGAHRWPLMTTLELTQYREWLDQRARLAMPGTFTWTWIQTHLPEWYAALVLGRDTARGFDEPVGPQPEQLRLLTYTALAAGCRGVGFWSDRFLADSHQGRDRLLTLALINQELDMLEPLLTTALASPAWIDTSDGDVKAAVLRSPRGVLVLPVWVGKGAQFVPGQAAAKRLSIIVPQVPKGTQSWEVTPGEVAGLSFQRLLGGTKVTLKEFGLTTAIVFTSDIGLIESFQKQSRSKRQLAAQWTYDLARAEMQKVLNVSMQLEKDGHTLPDGPALLDDVRKRLQEAKDLWEKRHFEEAYREAQRAMRPLRILMRAHWDVATAGLDSPVASPYALSFYTLPDHWRFIDEIKQKTVAGNVLPGGDFEPGSAQPSAPWRPQKTTLDDVELIDRLVTSLEVKAPPPKLKPGEKAKQDKTPAPVKMISSPTVQGKQCLMLRVKAKDPANEPQALQRTYLAWQSPTVKLPPRSLVQISGWVCVPLPIKASPDGALLYDSVGGEPLALRLTDEMAWRKFSVYRRVPPSGEINVTLAMTGVGTVYFDDVRIQPLVANAQPPATPIHTK